jgi:hypothetical protein
MFIRFAERGTALFCDLCVIVRLIGVYCHFLLLFSYIGTARLILG